MYVKITYYSKSHVRAVFLHAFGDPITKFNMQLPPSAPPPPQLRAPIKIRQSQNNHCTTT